MTKIGATPEPQKNLLPRELGQVQKENSLDTLIIAKPVDNGNGYVDTEQDVDFEKFLNDSKKNFEDFRKANQDEFGNFSKQSFGIQGKVEKNDKEVGYILPIMCKDSTSITINFKDGTVTKYSSDGKGIGQRALTAEEKQLSAQELADKLSKNFEIQENVDDVNNPDVVLKAQKLAEPTEKSDTKPAGKVLQEQKGFSDNARIAKNGYTVIKYEFIETEDGYSLLKDGIVVPFRNKDAIAFQRAFDLSSIQNVDYSVKQDSRGYYYRGLSSPTHSGLASLVKTQAIKIAEDGAVYRDLQARQANGEELKDYERKFMQEFLDSLTPLGLQMNENGEIVDLPLAKKGRKR